MKEREKINKILGDFSNELIAYLVKKKIIKIDGKKDKLEVWANFVKTDSRWKKYHTQFINKKYAKLNRFIKELSKTKEGQEKIVELYNIKNIKGYPKLLNKLQ